MLGDRRHPQPSRRDSAASAGRPLPRPAWSRPCPSPAARPCDPLPTNGRPRCSRISCSSPLSPNWPCRTGKITSAGWSRPDRSLGRDIAGEHLVAHRSQPFDHGLAADQADFALGTGAAVENSDFHDRELRDETSTDMTMTSVTSRSSAMARHSIAIVIRIVIHRRGFEPSCIVPNSTLALRSPGGSRSSRRPSRG